MTAARARVQVAALVRAWLLLDFFGDARRSGDDQGSSLTTTIMWQALLSFVFAMLLYPDVPPVPFVAANLCLSTLLIAVGALGDEDRPLRRTADATLLAGAPVSRAAVVLARAGHAAFQLVLVTTGMALPPAILLAHLTGEPLQAVGYVLAAWACSGVANGGLATARAVLGRVVGVVRATLLMGTAKALLLGGGFVLFALSLRALDGTADGLPIGRGGAELLPPYHAARLLHAPAAEAWRLLPWAGLVVLMLLVTVALTTSGEPTRVRVGQQRLLMRLLGRLTGRGPRRGVAEFVAASMWRSAGFRARVLPLLGLPAGMVFLTLAGGDDGSPPEHGFILLCLLLQLPAIYLPFLIAFLPRADQANTGWVFEHAPGLSLELVRDATWRALVTHVLVPTFALATALVVGIGPDRVDRGAAVVFAFALAVLASRPMTRVDRVPFTDDREEDRGLDFGALMAGALVLGGLGTAFGGVVPAALRWPVAIAATALAAVQLGRRPTAAAPAEAALAAADPAPEPTQPAEDEADDDEPRPRPTIARELRAVGVLYALLCVLPWLAGAAFAP